MWPGHRGGIHNVSPEGEEAELGWPGLAAAPAPPTATPSGSARYWTGPGQGRREGLPPPPAFSARSPAGGTSARGARRAARGCQRCSCCPAAAPTLPGRSAPPRRERGRPLPLSRLPPSAATASCSPLPHLDPLSLRQLHCQDRGLLTFLPNSEPPASSRSKHRAGTRPPPPPGPPPGAACAQAHCGSQTATGVRRGGRAPSPRPPSPNSARLRGRSRRLPLAAPSCPCLPLRAALPTVSAVPRAAAAVSRAGRLTDGPLGNMAYPGPGRRAAFASPRPACSPQRARRRLRAGRRGLWCRWCLPSAAASRAGLEAVTELGPCTMTGSFTADGVPSIFHWGSAVSVVAFQPWGNVQVVWGSGDCAEKPKGVQILRYYSGLTSISPD